MICNSYKNGVVLSTAAVMRYVASATQRDKHTLSFLKVARCIVAGRKLKISKLAKAKDDVEYQLDIEWFNRRYKPLLYAQESILKALTIELSGIELSENLVMRDRYERALYTAICCVRIAR